MLSGTTILQIGSAMRNGLNRVVTFTSSNPTRSLKMRRVKMNKRKRRPGGMRKAMRMILKTMTTIMKIMKTKMKIRVAKMVGIPVANTVSFMDGAKSDSHNVTYPARFCIDALPEVGLTTVKIATVSP